MSDVLAFLTQSFNLADNAPPTTTNINEELVLDYSVLGVLPHVEESMPLTFIFNNPVPGPVAFDETLTDTWGIITDTGYGVESLDLASLYSAELEEVILGSTVNNLLLVSTFSSFVDTAIPLVEGLLLTDYLLGYLITINRQNTYSPIGD